MSDVQEVLLESLAPELEGPVTLGATEPDLDNPRLRGWIATSPIGRAFEEVVVENGHEYKKTALDEQFSLWAVPHRCSLIKTSRLAAVTGLAIEVQYKEENGGTCSVLQLWPAPRYRLDASLEGHIRWPVDLPAGGTLALKVGALEMNVGRTSDATFAAKVVNPAISAVGVGSDQCAWDFDTDDPPLVGRDIETWSVLVLPRGAETIGYRMRIAARHRVAVVTTRTQSLWVDVTCPLVRRTPQ